jgi:uncharacterized protein (UPF0335 family)
VSADRELKLFVDRVLRCRELEDAAKDDTKAVYAELKAANYDKTTVGALVAELRKQEKNPGKFREKNDTLDAYRTAYERASHAHTREAQPNSPQSPDVVNPVAHAKPAPAESKGGTISAPIIEAAREMRARVGEFVDEHITQSREENSSLPTAKPEDDDLLPVSSGTLSPSASPAEKAPEPPPQVTQGSGAPIQKSGLCDTESIPAMAALAADESAAADAAKAETMAGSASAPIPDEAVPAFLRKDHEPTNPSCQKPATCKWARSMASCSMCAQAAIKARAA